MDTNKPRKKSVLSLQLLECVIVALCVGIGYLLASKLMYNACFPFGVFAGIIIYGIISIGMMIVLGTCGYFGIKEKPLPKIVTRVLFVMLILNLVFIALLYFSRSLRLSPYYFAVADAVQMALLMAAKLVFRWIKEEILAKNINLVIGSPERKDEVLRTFFSAGVRRLTFVDMKDERLMEYIKRADNIYLEPELTKKQKDEIISCSILQEKDIYLVPETYEIALWKSRLTQVGDVPVFNIETFKITEAQNIVKRAMDILGSLAGLIVLSPVMLIVALLIKKEDRGPIFYKQIRSGKNGKEFKVIKFRSMRPDAEKFTGAVFATDNDPRITKIGNILRATRLDEVPQFINVLMGDMSLVGPRPERPVFVEEFSKTIPEYKNRLAVKPGITGMAQVMGNYTTTPENKVRFDMMYIRDYSFFMDIKILFRTVKVVFTKEQATGFEEESKTMEILNLLETEPDMPMKRRPHRFLKGALITCCCLAILMGSMLLRYASIAMDVFAMAGPILTQAMNDGKDVDSLEVSTLPPPQSTDEGQNGNGSGSGIGSAGGDGQGQAAGSNGSGGAGQGTPSRSNGVGDSQTGPGTSANGGGTVTAQGGDSNVSNGAITISEQDIQGAMKEITWSEKINIAYKLVTKLKSDDLITLEEMASGGFTEEEKEIAKGMVYKYFNDEEIRQIYQLYVKYIK